MSFISRNRIYVIIAVSVALAGGCAQPEMNSGFDGNGGSDMVTRKIINTPAGAVEGQLLVCLSSDAAARLEAGESISATSPEGMNVKSFKQVFRVTEQNRKHLHRFNLDKWYQIEFDGMPTSTAAVTLAQLGDVAKVQFNTLSECGNENEATALTEEASENSDLPFNDRLLKDQWHYINVGDRKITSAAVEGADIGVKDVWSKLKVGGDKEIIVAVLDGPIKETHEDLAENMWVNIAEKNGEKGKDDDNNGFVDDIHGYNFESDTCGLSWNKTGESSHGTHVAGIVAAVNNNGIGVCGVAGGTGNGDGVRLMSCQILEQGRASNSMSAAQAFVYAADMGAHIAQCSFGYENSNYKSDYEYFYNYGIEYFAIQYFLDKKRFHERDSILKENNIERTKIIDGPLVIFAAGNSGSDRSSYPGALMDCICVTSIGPDGYPAHYTCYGPGSNIAAPGGDYLLSPSNSKSNVLSTYINDKNNVGDYAYMGGTSMACPHVSGVAALGLAYAKRLAKERGELSEDKYWITREDFVAKMLSSVNDIDSQLGSGYKTLENNLTRPYTSYQYNMGTGSIDAWKFMMSLEGTPVLTVKMGVKASYDLTRFFGEGAQNLKYTKVEMEREDKQALGLLIDPYIENGKLVIDPCKAGSGKIKITAIAGGSNVAGTITGDWTGNGGYVSIPNNNGGMGGMYITHEISVVARGIASKNGGWL